MATLRQVYNPGWNEILPTMPTREVRHEKEIRFMFELLGIDMLAIRSERLMQACAVVEAIAEMEAR